MFSTKNHAASFEEISPEWPFKHYLGIEEPFDGREFTMKSLFNPKDTRPSMSLFVWNGKYYFKDFSSGHFGDGVALVEKLYALTRKQAVQKIANDYFEFIRAGNSYIRPDAITEKEFEIIGYKECRWTIEHAKYWTRFGIRSDVLECYNVRPIREVVVQVNASVFELNDIHCYGYFKNDGTLYKIYRPYATSLKFIKVKDYIQGSEQLCGNHILLIESSLKDVAATASLGFRGVDLVAPDSENVLLPKFFVESVLKRYKFVFTLFDDDVAGIKAMNSYKVNYGIDYIYLPMRNVQVKDVADLREKIGHNSTRLTLAKYIDKKTYFK